MCLFTKYIWRGDVYQQMVTSSWRSSRYCHHSELCKKEESSFIHLSELCWGWMEVRQRARALGCMQPSRPWPCKALPRLLCFNSFPRDHAYAGRQRPQRCAQAVLSSWKELIIHLIRACYNAGSLIAVPGTRFLPRIQLRPSRSASVPRLQKDNCWSELWPVWVRGWESGSLGFV